VNGLLPYVEKRLRENQQLLLDLLPQKTLDQLVNINVLNKDEDGIYVSSGGSSTLLVVVLVVVVVVIVRPGALVV